MNGMLHTYNHDLFLKKNAGETQGFYFIAMFFIILLFDSQSNGSVLVKETVHILAPTLSLRNAITIV